MDVVVSPSFVVTNHISVRAAAEVSGYSLQYLRRLLRCGRLVGLKIGQVWLIDKTDFEVYQAKAKQSADLRFGPQCFFSRKCLRLYMFGVYICIHFDIEEYKLSVLVLDASNSMLKLISQ
jgi:excisionase family DNA binding protein